MKQFSFHSENKTGRKPAVQAKLRLNKPGDQYEQEADAMANKVVRMERSPLSRQDVPTASLVGPSIQRKCAHCEEEEKKKHIMRKEGSYTGNESESSQFIAELNTTKGVGDHLSNATRASMKSVFGIDFSAVRIHTDATANKLSRNINALAFTVGHDIYFGAGRFAPQTSSGRHLLAHELTHVVQQAQTSPAFVQRLTCPETAAPGRVAQTEGRNAIDARAERIINRAAEESTPISERATRSISDIICAYFPAQAGLVRNITYHQHDSGLHTTRVGRGRSSRGDIEVGHYFVSHVNRSHIARRVLQVAHELQHIQQYRSGMTGGSRSDEREFLAFHTEALADEVAGTGRMSHSTRLSLVDAALGYFYCLSSDLQHQNETKRQELLTRRHTLVASGRIAAPPPVPSSCRRP
ncbi:MAG TPA: DUF4157 domain-containing protein [Balneolales bacterium]|nr:DUF4157 domain-containing protein [Balneolales bacterium]